ncbi:MAG: TonB-dependent receptor [Thermoanaerobaculia bacterium]
MTRSPARAVVFAFALSSTTLGLAAWAQDPAEEPAAAAEPAAAEEPEVAEEEFREEITVTATKTGEVSIQDVPFSVVAQSEEVLRDRGAETIEDVAANVPGLTVQNLGPGQSQVAMRGVSAGQIARDQPGVKEQVGVYLDESVISLSLFTPDIDLFDMSRVEVLRGPQGTLFGSGSLTGTVRYITNQPEVGVSEQVGEFTLGVLTDGDFGGSAKVAANTPIGDTAALRVAAYYTSYGGYTDAVQPNLSTNEDVNTGDRTGVRLTLRAEPSDRLTITPRILYQEIDMDGWNRVDIYNILGNPFTTSRPAVDLDEREIFIQFDEPYTDEFLLADVNIEYDFEEVTLTSVTSYSDRDILVVRDATALTGSITGGSIGLPEEVYTLDAPLDDATTAKVLTQELRLSGEEDRLGWVAGAFYSTADRDYAQSLNVAGFEALTGIETEGNFGAGTDELFFSGLEYEFDQLALFGEVTWSVSDRFDLTGGLRYYDFKEDRIQTFDGIFADPGRNPGSTSADGFAPRAIASYEVSASTTLNAQVSKGFRLGGINDPLNVPLCTQEDLVTFGGRGSWKDEEVWNYEVGSKTTFLGGRGTFNLAAFSMDISDLQVTVTAGSCSSRVVFNVPEARSTGLELELTHQPTDDFDFAISASYNDAELRSTLTSTDADGNTTVVSGIQDGRRLPTVPEFQMAAAGTYHWEMQGNWAGYATGVYQHVGSRFTQVGDEDLGVLNLLSFEPNTIGGPLTQSTFTYDPELPAYDIVNLRLGFLKERWDVALFVNNVTDEIAFLSLDRERGTRARIGYQTNQPRTIGVSTRVHF